MLDAGRGQAAYLGGRVVAGVVKLGRVLTRFSTEQGLTLDGQPSNAWAVIKSMPPQDQEAALDELVNITVGPDNHHNTELREFVRTHMANAVRTPASAQLTLSLEYRAAARRHAQQFRGSVTPRPWHFDFYGSGGTVTLSETFISFFADGVLRYHPTRSGVHRDNGRTHLVHSAYAGAHAPEGAWARCFLRWNGDPRLLDRFTTGLQDVQPAVNGHGIELHGVALTPFGIDNEVSLQRGEAAVVTQLFPNHTLAEDPFVPNAPAPWWNSSSSANA